MVENVTGICWVVSIFGGIGGIGGGLYRRKCQNCPYLESWVETITFFISGAVSAFGTVLIFSGAEKLIGTNKLPIEGFTLVALSIVSGFFAMRLIPLIGSRLEKRFEEIGLKLSKAEIKVTEMEGRLRMADNSGKDAGLYSHLIVYAESVLYNKSKSECRFAVQEIRNSIDKFRDRRTLNIYFGRLLRLLGDLEGAILELGKYAKHMEKLDKESCLPTFERLGIGIAYYNMACYRCLMIKDVENEATALLEVQRYLKSAIAYDPMVEKEWMEDPDFRKLEKYFSDFLTRESF